MRSLLLSLSCLLARPSSAQVSPEKYWVRLSDKEGTPFSIAAPEQFLSERAIARRQRQGIPIDATDLPLSPSYLSQVEATGAAILSVSKWMNAIVIHAAEDAVLQAVLALPFVEGHKPVAKLESEVASADKLEALSADKAASSPWHDTHYGDAFNQIDMLNGTGLHKQGFRGEGMLIAVLDAGFTAANVIPVLDSLRQDGRIIATRDFVSRSDYVYRLSGHGTSVLSTMAALAPDAMVGTAPKASYMLGITEDVGSEYPIEEDFWVAGAEWADSAGADIINTSLGYTTFDDPAYNHSYQDMDGRTTHSAIASTMAARKGMLIVTSAGNQGNSSWRYISTPADADSILSIGAVSANRASASFSSIGPTADGRVKPNVCAQGHQAIIASTAGTIEPGNGTSFSGPIMAGMAACLWQSVREAGNMAVISAIERSADQFASPTPELGYGIPDFAKARLLLTGHDPSSAYRDELLSVHPNPFDSYITAQFYSAADQRLEARLVSVSGQALEVQEKMACKGCLVEFRFDGLGRAMPGIYAVQVSSSSGRYAAKAVKARP